MKSLAPLLLVLLVGCGARPAPQVVYVQVPVVEPKPEDGCRIKTSSQLKAERRVSEILNLEKDTDPNGRCTVKFDLIVDGERYQLQETETGWNQIPYLCDFAMNRARRNLLTNLGGEFKSETDITCHHTDNENG